MEIRQIKRVGATPETKQERRQATAGMVKCRCGNVLGLDRQRIGYHRCRGCVPDENLPEGIDQNPTPEQPSFGEMLKERMVALARRP